LKADVYYCMIDCVRLTSALSLGPYAAGQSCLWSICFTANRHMNTTVTQE